MMGEPKDGLDKRRNNTCFSNHCLCILVMMSLWDRMPFCHTRGWALLQRLKGQGGLNINALEMFSKQAYRPFLYKWTTQTNNMQWCENKVNILKSVTLSAELCSFAPNRFTKGDDKSSSNWWIGRKNPANLLPMLACFRRDHLFTAAWGDLIS